MKRVLLALIGLSLTANMAIAMSPIVPHYICENEQITVEIYEDSANVFLEGSDEIYSLEKINGKFFGKSFYLGATELAALSFKKGLFSKASFSLSSAVKVDDKTYNVKNILEISARCKKF